MKIDEVRELVEYMKSKGVVKFRVGTVEVEFNLLEQTGVQPQTIDTEEERAKNLRATLTDALKKADEDLFWSA